MEAKVGTQARKDVEANSVGRRRGVWAFSAAGVRGAGGSVYSTELRVPSWAARCPDMPGQMRSPDSGTPSSGEGLPRPATTPKYRAHL